MSQASAITGWDGDACVAGPPAALAGTHMVCNSNDWGKYVWQGTLDIDNAYNVTWKGSSFGQVTGSADSAWIQMPGTWSKANAIAVTKANGDPEIILAFELNIAGHKYEYWYCSP